MQERGGSEKAEKKDKRKDRPFGEGRIPGDEGTYVTNVHKFWWGNVNRA